MIGRIGTEAELDAFVRERVAELLAAAPIILRGTGSPAAKVAAPVGALYVRTDGGAGSTLYVKESGTGSSGWAAK